MKVITNLLGATRFLKRQNPELGEKQELEPALRQAQGEIEDLKAELLELKLQRADIGATESLKALAGEPPDSAILRLFRKMIRDRREVAIADASDPDSNIRDHAIGGVFYLDDLERTLVDQWLAARDKKFKQ